MLHELGFGWLKAYVVNLQEHYLGTVEVVRPRTNESIKLHSFVDGLFIKSFWLLSVVCTVFLRFIHSLTSFPCHRYGIEKQPNLH